VLRDVALELNRGEVLSLVGQSGCGKSTLALCILRLLHLKRGTVDGRILFQGTDLLVLRERDMRAIRGKEIALVLQSPISALNPVLRIGTQFNEAWNVHRSDSSRRERECEIAETLRRVSLPADPSFLRRYPSELSVGQAQRVLIGMAVLHRPLLLIADEPTSALDVLTQSEVIGPFASLSRELKMGVLFISHDLLSVGAISDRVAVMHAGEIVENQSARDIFMRPMHPYTRQLIGALPAIPNFDAAAGF